MVPSPQQEQQRSSSTLPRATEAQSAPGSRRGVGRWPSSQGILAPVGWWRPAAWQQFKAQLPEWLGPQLAYWQAQALAIEGQERQVRRQLEQRVSRELPLGVGALSWITLQLEIRGWERFQNRRQIGSYTGLCPGTHQSNGRGREGHINRGGNPAVRYTLIEMVWRLVRWQPDYPPLQKLRRSTSKRAKRRLAESPLILRTRQLKRNEANDEEGGLSQAVRRGI